VAAISDKLIRRHPHVFGEKKDLKPDEVRDQWENIKVNSGEKKSVLGGLPRSMPALMMAFRVGEKAGGVGFDWEQPAEVLDKLSEEIDEIRAELKSDNKQALTEEIGDLLFATASLARKLDIDPERALVQVKGSNRRFDDYNLEELEAIWQNVKK